jgi:hypothetical protein
MFLFLPVAKKFMKHPATTFIMAAITLYFIVYAILEPEDIWFYLLFTLIGIVTTIRSAKSSGLLK